MNKTEILQILQREHKRALHKGAWSRAINGLNFLEGENLSIALEGINRYLRACERMETPITYDAFWEIIDDAKLGQKVWQMDGFIGGQRTRKVMRANY